MSNTTSGGSSFAALLTVLFIGLKLLGKIDWSWWWVLSPIWISAAIALVLIGMFILWTILVK